MGINYYIPLSSAKNYSGKSTEGTAAHSSVPGHRKKKKKPHLKEPPVQKRSSPKTLPKSIGKSTNLSGSESLASHMAFTPPYPHLQESDQSRVHHPNQPSALVSSRTPPIPALIIPLRRPQGWGALTTAPDVPPR